MMPQSYTHEDGIGKGVMDPRHARIWLRTEPSYSAVRP
jgi:hypothetical protein